MNLITGGLGYIGRHLAMELPPSVIIDDNSTGDPSLAPLMASACLHKVIEGDFADPAMFNIMREHKVKTVFHLAAKTSVTEGEIHPDMYYRENTLKIAALLDMAALAGVEKFVFASSAAVYGEPPDVVAHLDARLVPTNWYGRTKMASESLLQLAANTGMMRVGIARFFNVIGADTKGRCGRDRGGDVLSLMIEALIRQKTFHVYGFDCPTSDGSPGRDYIDVNDVVVNLKSIAQELEFKPFVRRNVGSGHITTVIELLEAVEKVSGRKIPYTRSEKRPGEIEVIVSDNKPADLYRIERSVRHALRWAERCNS